jgi:hypothetical protein
LGLLALLGGDEKPSPELALRLVLRADGRADPLELCVLKDIARKLDISEALVDRTVGADLDPD